MQWKNKIKTHVFCDECGQELNTVLPIFGVTYQCDQCSK